MTWSAPLFRASAARATKFARKEEPATSSSQRVILLCSLLGEYVAKAGVHHIGVRVLRVPRRGGNRPRAPDQVRILGDDLQPSVVFVRPQSRDDADRAFLNGSVRRVRRSWETKAHASETRDAVARRSWRRGQESKIALEVRAAVVAVEHVVRRRLVFKTADAGTGVNSGKGSVGFDDDVGAQAEDVTAAAVAVKGIGDEVQIVNNFVVHVQ